MVDAEVAAERLKRKMSEIESKQDVTRNLPANYSDKLRDDQLHKELEDRERERKSEERRSADAQKAAEQLQREQDRRAKEQASAEKAARDKELTESRDRRESRRAMFNADRERVRTERIAAEKETARRDKAEQKIRDAADEVARQQQTAERKEQDRIAREEAGRQKAADAQRQAYQRKMNSAKQPSQRVSIRQAMEQQQQKEAMRRRSVQQVQDARNRGMIVPPRVPITADRMKQAIGTGLSRIGNVADVGITSAFGGFANSIVTGRPQKQSNRLYRQETKALSGAVRNRELGRNPFKQVIGASGSSRIAYETDGHGRSGHRATLEWRRNNRQYTSEARANAAAINQNWVNDVAGIPPEPVRQRHVHTRHGRRMSPLESFVNNIGGF